MVSKRHRGVHCSFVKLFIVPNEHRCNTLYVFVLTSACKIRIAITMRTFWGRGMRGTRRSRSRMIADEAETRLVDGIECIPRTPLFCMIQARRD